MNFEKIVERALILKDESGGQVKICIEIGCPRWIEVDLEAVCPVFIRGLMKKPLDIYGSDLLNALECAQRFIKAELSNLSANQEVLWPDGEIYFDQERE